MKTIVTSIVLTLACLTATAQESHYRRALRTEKQNQQYGVVGMGDSHASGMTSGIYWSRVRDADDAAIVVDETKEDSLVRVSEFKRLCQLAYDAYEEARQSYKDAVGAGHPSGAAAYKAFKKREKQRQKAK